MTTTFQPQSHKVVSYQHPITCVETLSVRFPALCPLLHNRPIERKVHPSELNVVDETVAVHSFGKETHKDSYKGKVVDIYHIPLLISAGAFPSERAGSPSIWRIFNN